MELSDNEVNSATGLVVGEPSAPPDAAPPPG
jgi:hypothetical protein